MISVYLRVKWERKKEMENLASCRLHGMNPASELKWNKNVKNANDWFMNYEREKEREILKWQIFTEFASCRLHDLNTMNIYREKKCKMKERERERERKKEY